MKKRRDARGSQGMQRNLSSKLYGLNENLIKVHIFREEGRFCDCRYCEDYKKLELKKEQKLTSMLQSVRDVRRKFN